MKKVLQLLVATGMAWSICAPQAWAWGRRGHSTVAFNAAYLAAGDNPDLMWLKAHSYDLGYYANVPDFIWKRGDNYLVESPEHYINMEIFDRAFKAADENAANALLDPDRTKFEASHADVPVSAGRAFWRIQELYDRLEKITQGLSKPTNDDEHRKLQGEWLVTAGIMAHYVGDLSMPLHCSENHDGQLSDQKGIHAFFEDVVVDEMYSTLEKASLDIAHKRWKKFHAENKDKTPFAMGVELCRNSQKEALKLLAIDKKVGRNDLPKAVAAYRSMIDDRIARSTLMLAELWGRQADFKFDDKKFFFFDEHPEYIQHLGKVQAPPKK